MNLKQTIGLIILVLGATSIFFGARMMYRISKAKEDIHSMKIPFSDKPVGIVSGESLEQISGKSDKQAMWYLVGGTVLFIVGGGMIFIYKGK